MKNLILLAVGLLLQFMYSTGVVAGTIDWRPDIEAAQLESTRSGKPLLIEVATSWCSHCRKMEQETLADDQIAARINKHFVPLKLDGDEHKKFVEEFGITTYPSIIIAKPNLDNILMIIGFRAAEQLTTTLTPYCDAALTATVAANSAQAKSQGVLVKEPKSGKDGPLAKLPKQKPSLYSKQLPKLPNATVTLQVSSTVSAELEQPFVPEGNQSVFGLNCPVSPVESGQLAAGSTEFSHVYRGFTLQFSTAKALARFKANPIEFWPVADGRCIVSVVEERDLHFGKLEHGLVFADRIWLFSNAERLEKFRDHPERYLRSLVEISEQRAQKVH